MVGGTIKGPSSMGGGISNKKSGTGDLDRLLTRGYSAYDIAVLNGFVGSQSEWLESLKGGQVELKQENDIIYWKYHTDEIWAELVNLGDTIDRKIEAAQVDLSTVRLVDDFPEVPFKNILYVVRGED